MESTDIVSVQVLAFGPLAERLGGRSIPAKVVKGTTVEALIGQLELTSWIDFGLAVAVNGSRVGVDTLLHGDEEVALLPPVSGG